MDAVKLENTQLSLLIEKMQAATSSDLSVVEEPFESYGTEKEVSYSWFFGDKFLVNRAISTGVTWAHFTEIMSNSPFDLDQWAGFIQVNLRTLNRYEKDQQHLFKPAQAERIFQVLELILYGYEVLGSKAHFKTWIEQPVFSLGNQKPSTFFSNAYGRDLVEGVLDSIEYGIPA